MSTEKAELAYKAYVEAVGGTSFKGKPLPAWSDLDERQKEGWRAVVKAILQ